MTKPVVAGQIMQRYNSGTEGVDEVFGRFLDYLNRTYASDELRLEVTAKDASGFWERIFCADKDRDIHAIGGGVHVWTEIKEDDGESTINLIVRDYAPSKLIEIAKKHGNLAFAFPDFNFRAGTN